MGDAAEEHEDDLFGLQSPHSIDSHAECPCSLLQTAFCLFGLVECLLQFLLQNGLMRSFESELALHLNPVLHVELHDG
jgi:hypothetical protein